MHSPGALNNMVTALTSPGATHLVLTPNRSISWAATVRLWLGLCALSLSIGIGMALAGAWLVLPFTGLELVALGAGLWYVARQGLRKEVVVFQDARLRLEQGLGEKETEWEHPRTAVCAVLEESRHPWDPPRLYLRAAGEDRRLGAFLNRQDLAHLTRLLEDQGLSIQRRQAEPAEVAWF